jgi:hypothetical protein
MRSLIGDALGHALEILCAAHSIARAAAERSAGAIAHHVSAARAVLAIQEVLSQRAYAAGHE